MDYSKIQSIKNLQPIRYPCTYHNGQLCYNYCIDMPCFKALCAQCVEEHVVLHERNSQSDLNIKTIKGVRIEALNKVTKIIESLFGKMHSLPPIQNSEQMFQQITLQIRQVKEKMHDIIQRQFGLFQEKVKLKCNQSMTYIHQLENLNDSLAKIIQQLKQHHDILAEARYATYEVKNGDLSDSIKKILTLDQIIINDKFQQEIGKYEDLIRRIHININFDISKFQTSIWDSLQIFNDESISQQHGRSRATSQTSHKHPLGNPLQHKDYILNMPPTSPKSKSKNKTLKQSSINQIVPKIIQPSYKNSFKTLHFFEDNSNKLHLININEQHLRHQQIDLQEFTIPAFHSSILCEQSGFIFLSGGTIQLSSTMKSKNVAKFSLSTKQFKKDFAKVKKPRSSHSMCQDKQWVYILGGYGEQIDEQTPIENQVQRVNIKSGKVERLKPSNWGGANIAMYLNGKIIKICSQGVQCYNFQHDEWNTYKVNYTFYRACGYSKINDTQFLVYGGYNQQQQSVRQCCLWTFNHNNFKINKLNASLPKAQGFWNNPGISDGKNIYVLQNIEQQQGTCADNQRVVIKFDGSSWKNIEVKK